jgi:hypothetical protein
MSDDEEDLYQDYLADQNDHEGLPPFEEPPSDLDDDDNVAENQNANDDNESLGSDASTVEESNEFADPTGITTGAASSSSSSKPEYQFEP